MAFYEWSLDFEIPYLREESMTGMSGEECICVFYFFLLNLHSETIIKENGNSKMAICPASMRLRSYGVLQLCIHRSDSDPHI